MITEDDINGFDENDIEDFDQFVEMYGFRERLTEDELFDSIEDYEDDF